MTSTQQVHIRADSCARARLTTSRCEACVRSCPTQAWSLDDGDLCFDSDRCDACGLCVVACPLEAIESDPPALLIGSEPPRTLWLACDKATTHSVDSQGLVPCLHGLPVTWLLQQTRRHHIERIACASGDCSRCARLPVAQQRLQNRWTDWARCHPSDTALPALVQVPPGEWRRQTQNLGAPDKSRRRFLSGRFAPPGQGARTGDRFGSGRLEEIAPERGALPLARWRLDWNLQTCTWCMVCAHLCPTRALTIVPTAGEDSKTLAVHTQACSGCGLCVDGCDVGALSLQPLPSPAPGATKTYPLQRATCGRCRVDFWRTVVVEGQSTRRPDDSFAVATGAQTDTCPTCVRGKLRWEQRVVQHQD